MKISLGEAVACVFLTAALPGLFGMGLAGMALGSTLPRLFSSCLLYPWLAVQSLGIELQKPFMRGIAKILVLTAAVTLVFWCIHASMANLAELGGLCLCGFAGDNTASAAGRLPI